MNKVFEWLPLLEWDLTRWLWWIILTLCLGVVVFVIDTARNRSENVPLHLCYGAAWALVALYCYDLKPWIDLSHAIHWLIMLWPTCPVILWWIFDLRKYKEEFQDQQEKNREKEEDQTWNQGIHRALADFGMTVDNFVFPRGANETITVFYLDQSGQLKHMGIKSFLEFLTLMKNTHNFYPTACVIRDYTHYQNRLVLGSNSWRVVASPSNPDLEYLGLIQDQQNNHLRIEATNPAAKNDPNHYILQILRIVTQYASVREYAQDYYIKLACIKLRETRSNPSINNALRDIRVMLEDIPVARFVETMFPQGQLPSDR